MKQALSDIQTVFYCDGVGKRSKLVMSSDAIKLEMLRVTVHLLSKHVPRRLGC